MSTGQAAESRPARGRFISLEGIEGAGKSTQASVVAAELRALGVPFILTREPGGAPMAERIRALLLDPAQRGLCADAELLLMFAARAEHLHQTLRPALETGTWVVCDRFTDASFAYQGGGRGVAFDAIAGLESLVQRGLRPDLTLLLDIPAELGLARARARSAPDRFEAETLAFFERARAVYLERAEGEPERFRMFDARQPIATLSAQVSAEIKAFAQRTGWLPA